MFAFDLLGVGFANGMRSRGEVPFIDPRPIRVEVLQAKRLEQPLQLPKDLIGSSAKGIRQDHARQMINRLPEPALMSFTPDKTPHFIDLGGFDAPHFDRDRVRTTSLYHAGVDLGKPGGFFLIPAARYWTRRAGRGRYRGSHSH